MIKPETSLKKLSKKALSEYLFDAFERHSLPHHADMDEMSHAKEMKKSVAPLLMAHNANKAVSQEMWVVAILINQFQRSANPSLTVSPALESFGSKIYDNPVFTETFSKVREYLRTIPELKRA